MTTVVRHFMPATAKRLIPNRWDLIAFPLLLGFLLMATTGIRETWAPLTALQTVPITLGRPICRNTHCAPRCACWPRWPPPWSSP